MIKLFCDCADLEQIKLMSKNPMIKGFTTNPTLVHKAGVTDYKTFCQETVDFLAKNRPDTCISFEVFTDDISKMYAQALTISSWNTVNYPVYIKIPITITTGHYTCDILWLLSKNGIKVNVTAVFTDDQIQLAKEHLWSSTPSIISIFAGRIFDTGVDPTKTINIYDNKTFREEIQYLWASPRQVYDYKLAGLNHYDIITMTPELIKKLDLYGKDLTEYSKETVKMFYEDGKKTGFEI
jgi:transaldolase